MITLSEEFLEWHIVSKSLPLIRSSLRKHVHASMPCVVPMVPKYPIIHHQSSLI